MSEEGTGSCFTFAVYFFCALYDNKERKAAQFSSDIAAINALFVMGINSWFMVRASCYIYINSKVYTRIIYILTGVLFLCK